MLKVLNEARRQLAVSKKRGKGEGSGNTRKNANHYRIQSKHTSGQISLTLQWNYQHNNGMMLLFCCCYVCVHACERVRETDRQTQRDRQRERERQRKRKRDRESWLKKENEKKGKKRKKGWVFTSHIFLDTHFCQSYRIDLDKRKIYALVTFKLAFNIRSLANQRGWKGQYTNIMAVLFTTPFHAWQNLLVTFLAMSC